MRSDVLLKAPHENISKWVGALYFDGEDKPIPVGMNQFILRGCTLRNTDWIIGIVVFTGVETKIALNNKETAFKRSNVCVFCLYTSFCVSCHALKKKVLLVETVFVNTSKHGTQVAIDKRI